MQGSFTMSTSNASENTTGLTSSQKFSAVMARHLIFHFFFFSFLASLLGKKKEA